MVRIKRVHDKRGGADGVRILVDRLWPRGVTKGEVRIDEWRKDLAPTKALRQWFDHDPSKWEEFQLRYRKEMEVAGKMDELRILGDRAGRGTITLVYAARDEERNNAVVIKKLIDMLSGLLAPRHDPPGGNATPKAYGGRQPGGDDPPGTRKAALPQPSPYSRDIRALDREIRAAALGHIA